MTSQIMNQKSSDSKSVLEALRKAGHGAEDHSGCTDVDDGDRKMQRRGSKGHTGVHHARAISCATQTADLMSQDYDEECS